MPENCAAIINRLIDERHNQRMTQKDLAEAASPTQSAIARLESKKVWNNKVDLCPDGCYINSVPIRENV